MVPTIQVLGIPLACLTIDEAIERALGGGLVLAPSGPGMCDLERDPVAGQRTRILLRKGVVRAVFCARGDLDHAWRRRADVPIGDDEARGDNEGWVREFIDRPLTPGVIERLLDG